MKVLEDIPRDLMLSNSLYVIARANKETPIWVAVMDICSVDSRSAIAICESAGWDPTQKIYDYQSLHGSEFCDLE